MSNSRGRSIRRLKAGIAARIGLALGKTHLDKVVFDFEYTYRSDFVQEALNRTSRLSLPAGTLIYRTAGEPFAVDAGVLSRMSIGAIDKGSRSYLNAAISVCP